MTQDRSEQRNIIHVADPSTIGTLMMMNRHKFLLLNLCRANIDVGVSIKDEICSIISNFLWYY